MTDYPTTKWYATDEVTQKEWEEITDWKDGEWHRVIKTEMVEVDGEWEFHQTAVLREPLNHVKVTGTIREKE